ncbi:hypothetical protein [Candidatus Mycoplasma haematohominis]|uniref:hypothetical protein n=1 Tax=Candidatus Mycoplasma haematohominis TaxID=1494318 RepID=UPI001C0A6F2F|nr:hypothetical protein [Candidatus Mycoplasma haemohominis]
MWKYLGKLLLGVLGIGSPFVTTMYLTNAPKTPNPFDETLKILEMVEIEEEDKIFEEEKIITKPSEGLGGGHGTGEVLGDPGTSNQSGSSSPSTGQKASEEKNAGPQTEDNSGTATSTEGDRKENQDSTSTSDEKSKESTFDSEEQAKKLDPADSSSQPEDAQQNQQITEGEPGKSTTDPTPGCDPDPCLNITLLIGAIIIQGGEFGDIMKLIKDTGILQQCIEKSTASEAKG